MPVLSISIDLMPFLAPNLDNTDPLFARLITPGFDLHNIELVDQDPTCGSLYADRLTMVAYLIT